MMKDIILSLVFIYGSYEIAKTGRDQGVVAQAKQFSERTGMYSIK
jgi:hypothetical protein